MEPLMLVHGGGDDIPSCRVKAKLDGVKESTRIGFEILNNGGTSLDAVEAAIRYMEEVEVFNCGYGSVLNIEGEVEMDASIMVGTDLNAGAVTCVKEIAHPISLARLVLEKCPHVLLNGNGANKFAKEQGVPTVPSGSLVTKFNKGALEQLRNGTTKKVLDVGGTVGAVAIDKDGHLAAGTSTGGLNGKMVGRTGDTPIIGGGTYADDEIGAVSITGHGESILKSCLAHSIIMGMENGKSAQEAATSLVAKMKLKLNNTAGAVCISKSGDVGIAFTTNRMPWAYQNKNQLHFGVEPNDHQ